MSVITNSLAKEISEKMVNSKVRDNGNTLKLLKDQIYEALYASLDPEVLQAAKKYKQYISTQNCVRLVGEGFNHQTIYLEHSLPLPKGVSCHVVEPDKKQGKRWIGMYNTYETKKKDIEVLRVSIQNALLTLKTFKRVKDNFPEAVPFLPLTQSTALVVDLSQIRKQL